MTARLAALCCALLLAGTLGMACTGPRQRPDWDEFKARFVTADGRVVDTGNGGVSHTEGQGYGMLLAAAADDRATFDRLWDWTQAHLALRADGLLAWRWDQRDPKGSVSDPNSAADGDLLIAWALVRAAQAWSAPAYLAAGRDLAGAIRSRLVTEVGGEPVLLPGPEGFVHDGRVTVNLSYWVFPAFKALAIADPSPVWAALAASGARLLGEARFGAAGLPPDWLDLATPPVPAAGFPPVFGYNAVRIPLYLVWSGSGQDGLLAPFRALWRDGGGPMPAEVGLLQPGQAGAAASTGMQAVAQLTLHRSGEPAPAFPPLATADDYYAASLLLLAKLAFQERYGR